MLNLEVHYVEGVDSEIDFENLGEACRAALAEVYNLLNQPLEPVSASQVLVRFIMANPHDLGIPDVCFVIKCGRPNLPRNYIYQFCETIRCKVGQVMIGHGLSFDVEMFNVQSHGLCVNGGGEVTDQF